MLSREAVNRELGARQSRKFLCDFEKKSVFAKKPFREKRLVTKYSRNSSESFCMKMWFLISLKQISREALSRELLAKVPLNQFLKKNRNMHFEQKLKTQKYQKQFQKLIKH